MPKIEVEVESLQKIRELQERIHQLEVENTAMHIECDGIEKENVTLQKSMGAIHEHRYEIVSVISPDTYKYKCSCGKIKIYKGD